MPTLVPRFSALLVGSSLLTASLGLTPASAQEVALLTGVVAAQETMVPVASAKVTLVGTDFETVSQRDGTFAFQGVPLGPATVRVDAPGFTTMVQQVEVAPDVVIFMQFLLPSVAAFLDDILVIGHAQTPWALSETRTVADLLVGQIPGVGGNSGIVGLDRSEVHLRGVNSIDVSAEPVIFIDGVRMAGNFGEALSMLRQIPASDVQDIRLERGPASAFLQGSVDGAIYIRTKSGPASH